MQKILFVFFLFLFFCLFGTPGNKRKEKKNSTTTNDRGLPDWIHKRSCNYWWGGGGLVGVFLDGWQIELRVKSAPSLPFQRFSSSSNQNPWTLSFFSPLSPPSSRRRQGKREREREREKESGEAPLPPIVVSFVVVVEKKKKKISPKNMCRAPQKAPRAFSPTTPNQWTCGYYVRIVL